MSDEDYVYFERLGILIDGELTTDGKMIRPPTQMEVKMANDDVVRWKKECERDSRCPECGVKHGCLCD